MNKAEWDYDLPLPHPTHVGHFFTKLLQGALFQKFWNALLGYQHADTLNDDPPSPDEEHVGDHASDDGGTITPDHLETPGDLENQGLEKDTKNNENVKILSTVSTDYLAKKDVSVNLSWVDVVNGKPYRTAAN